MKLKSFLALLLATAVIVLGALLPKFIGERQDAANDNQLLFAPINDVRLEFTQEEITMSQTVAIQAYQAEAVEIPYGLTSLGKEKAEAAALAAMERYQQAGTLFQNITDQGQFIYCQPVLMYGATVSGSIAEQEEQRYDSSGNNRQSNIYWDIAYSNTSNDAGFYSCYFHFIIDDRTGTVCSVDYSDGNHRYKQEDMEFILASFCDSYLSELGEEFYWCDVEDIVANAKAPLDNSYLASDISWTDSVYGECRITFFVNENGFYTHIQ